MAITLGFGLASDAQSAAEQFIAQINKVSAATLRMGESIEKFNAKGELISQTFKALTADGKQLEATLKTTASGYELISGKTDAATASLRALEAQQKAAIAATRRADALSAEGMLSGAKGLQAGQNINQTNAAEAALQRVRAAIESGAVSLARFQQLYAQITANPKAIIPNMTAEETALVKALRTIATGFDKTGDKAERTAERITISWQGVLRLFEAQVIKRLTGALQSSLVDGVQSAVDFSVRIAEVGTISQKSGVSLSEWSEGIRRLSSQFGNTQADVAEAAYQSLSNQVTKGAETFQFLESALRFSKASVTSAADSVNLLSSAMKSFNIPTSEAERVASIFFKTIELGRVRGNEMADTFGRVGTIAADAGVKLEEVAAAVTTLTIKGMKFSDASTLISNMLLKLIRPTDAMKELFQQWGVASGQAAIATFGFGGVLQKLDVEAQKGSNRLGELFNQIRAFRGAINLTGNSFGDFQKDLAEITEGQGDFNKAVDIVMQSFGDRVKRQINEVKNYFSTEFGDGIIQAAVKIAEGLGGMANVLAKVEKFLTPIILGLVGYKAGVLGATLATASYNTVLAMFTTTAATATVAVDTTAVAMQNLNAALGGFGIGFTIGMMIFNQDDERRIEKIAKDLEKVAALKFDTLRRLDPTTSDTKGEIDQLKTDFDNRYKIILQFNRNNVLAADDAKKKAIQGLKEVTEQTKVSSRNYFDAISQGLKQIRDAATEAKQMIEASLKASEGVNRKLADSIFDTKMKYASEGRIDASGLVVDDQKITLIKAKLAEVTDLARRKFKEGTKESVEDARRLYAEAEKLTSDLFDASTKKQRAEFDERVRRGTQAPVGLDFDPVTGQMKQRFEFTVKTAEIEQQLRAIAQEKLRAERLLRIEKEKQLIAAQDLELREKERVKRIQQAIGEIEKLRVLDDKGDPATRFKEDPRQALREFDRQAAIARRAASELEVRDRLATLDFLNKQREALEKEVNTRLLAERARLEAETTQMQAKAVQDRLTQMQGRFDEAQSRMANEARRIATTIGTIMAADAAGPGRLERMFDLKLDPKAQAVIAAIREQLNALKITALEANETFAANKTQANLDKNIKAMDDFIAKYKEYIKVSTGKEVSELDSRAPGVQRFQELLRERQQLQGSMDQRTRVQEDLATMQAAGDRMRTSMGEIPNFWTLFDQAVSTTTPRITESLDKIIAKTDSLILKAREAAAAIAAMGGQVPVPEARQPGGFFGGQPRTYAFGGRGSDDQLAYINKREEVMNEQATNAWSPLLRAMNAGMTPNQMSGGGTVTTVGDINISMQSGAPADQNVRTFAKSLRRAIRRGTVSLE